MKIQVLVDNPGSWIVEPARSYVKALAQQGHEAQLRLCHSEVTAGNVLILLGCEKRLSTETRKLNEYNLVVHESALPQGRGWSPLTWQVLEGKNSIPITLFEAVDQIDGGVIYGQKEIFLSGTELISDLRELQARVTFQLINEFIDSYPNVVGTDQSGIASYYPRRGPEDSELDPNKSLAEQFNLLRVVDNDRYPAFFKIKNKKYIVKIFPDK